ncbi:hypothetical protein [Maricaulis sp.]|uniref:hypothetical protein n=1 Tax=unclassified Maricaulis TaxID=2632371 RepID=UPI001B2EAF1E|nr:hypothetical protein [Maricaulis sp.]MBO6797046.1 hypothetical protein [Maricaulis sp.]
MLNLLQLLAWLLALAWFVILSFVLLNPMALLDVPSEVAGGLWGLQLLWMPLAVVVLVVAATLTIKQKPRIAFDLVVLAPLLWYLFVVNPQIRDAEYQQYLIDCGDVRGGKR